MVNKSCAVVSFTVEHLAIIIGFNEILYLRTALLFFGNEGEATGAELLHMDSSEKWSRLALVLNDGLVKKITLHTICYVCFDSHL